MGYKVDAPVRIEIQVAVPGQEEPAVLAHLFRQPTPEEWVRFEGAVSRAIAEKNDEAFYMRHLELWRDLVQSVEGYQGGDLDLMLADNWRDMVPAAHQYTALRAWERVSEVQKKNSETASAKS